MPRVLFITTAELTLRSFLLPLAAHLRSRGIGVDGMARGATTSPRCREGFDAVHEASWSRSPLDLRGAWRGYREVRRVVAEGGYRLVHVHTHIAAFITRLALRRLRREGEVTVIYTAHGFYFSEQGGRLANFVYRTLERLAGRWTDRLVVINDHDERAALTHRIVPEERLRRMPGIGIDLDEWSPDRVPEGAIASLRAELGIGDDPYFVYVAELNWNKRHRDAIAALAGLDRPDGRLLFAGLGPARDRIEETAGRLGVARRVHFLGWRDDVPIIVAGAVAMVMPSEREGLPRSVMESMALGTPVVATDVRGNRDLLTGGGGVLVPVGDVAAMAATMQRLLDDPAGAAALGEQGRVAVEGYGLDTVLALHDRLYAEAAGI